MTEPRERTAQTAEPVVIKKYANRRLYNTETSSYVTLDDLARMVRSDRDFIVRDAKTGEDLTHAVLTQIIVEQEGKSGGPNLLPIPFLRQLIRYYDDSISNMVPSYLQFSMDALTKEQEKYRSQISNWGPNAFEAYQEQARKNLAMFETAFGMWQPATGPVDQATASGQEARPEAHREPGPEQQPQSDDKADVRAEATAANGAAKTEPADEPLSDIDQLKAELAAMQAKIEQISSSS